MTVELGRIKFKIGVRHMSEMFFFLVPVHFFGSTCTISSFGVRFLDGLWSVSCLPAVPPPRASVKLGASALVPCDSGATGC